jgi:hypothetical protein
MGIAPFLYACLHHMKPWVRLNVSTSRNLATSRPHRLNRRAFTLLVHESPRCENSTRIHPLAARSHLILTHASPQISALRHFVTRRPHEFAPWHFVTCESLVPPVLHSRSAMAHTAPAVEISPSRNLAIPVPKFSNLFLRGPETRSLTQIQRSSCVTDPTAILLSLPRDLATWSTQMLDSKPVSSRACEIR